MRKLLLAALLVFAAHAVDARVFMTQQQALASAFPAGTKVVRQTFFLTAQQLDAARKSSGVQFNDQLIVRYAGMAGDKVVGYAYFDSHRVRTLPETVMIVVTPDARVQRVDILSFDEPTDYQPRPRWIEQLNGKKLDGDLSLRGAVRPITGASLSGAALVNASRKVLAIHQAIGSTTPR